MKILHIFLTILPNLSIYQNKVEEKRRKKKEKDDKEEEMKIKLSLLKLLCVFLWYICINVSHLKMHYN